MHLEVLVEESSAEAALGNLLPKIVGREVTHSIHPHQGKSDLLDKLPSRLRGYENWLPADWRIVVLVDQDRSGCREIKGRLERAAAQAGLVTKSTRLPSFQVLNRLAVEELEAWFFGDVEAIVQAYPGVPPILGQKARYRDPDAIAGGTWEALERVLQRAGYFRNGLRKIEAARAISAHMAPERNRSRSFRVFRDALREIAQP